MLPKVIRNLSALDANESTAFLRQLEFISKRLHEVSYPTMKARLVIPINTEVPPGAASYTWRQFDRVGQAIIVRDYSADLPRVDVLGEEATSQIQSLADSFGWNVQEVKQMAMTGFPLEQRRALTAREAIMRLENGLAFSGSAAFNMVGFLAIPNTQVIALPAVGTGNSILWSTKTPDQILDDLNAIETAIMTGSLGVEEADTLLLPLAQFNYIKKKKIGIENQTILDFFLEHSVSIKTVGWLNELKAAGANATDRAMAYKKDAEKVEMIIPQQFEMLPPQEKGLEFLVNCLSRFGGVVTYKPLSIGYADGI